MSYHCSWSRCTSETEISALLQILKWEYINNALYKALQIFLLHTSTDRFLLGMGELPEVLQQSCRNSSTPPKTHCYLFSFIPWDSAHFQGIFSDTSEVIPSSHPPAHYPHIKVGRCPFGAPKAPSV